MHSLEDGYRIAVRSLRRCYRHHGILAGTTHYSDVWSRDSMFASFGACALGDFSTVRKNIELLLSHQREDGLIPLRVGQKNMILKFLGMKDGLNAVYKEDKNGNIPPDSNSLVIIASLNYVKITGDSDFASRNFKFLEKAISWYLPEDHLIEERPYCSWDDAIKKSGKVLYTNVLYCRALMDMQELSDMTGQKRGYAKKSAETKKAINSLFWNGRFYVDWIGGGEKYLSAPSNLLAVLFGIADMKKSESILSEIGKMDAGFALWNVTPRYGKRWKSVRLSVVGMSDYSDGLIWLWPSCLYALVLKKTGQDALPIMEAIARKIADYGTVYEVYNPNGSPLRRFFYRSEKNFAWSSGLFVFAYNQIFKDHSSTK